MATNAARNGARVSCQEALRVVNRYFHLPASAYQGSGAYAEVRGWMCGSTSGGEYKKTGHAGDCRRRGGLISMDKKR
jgi:hypothetical protein